MTPLDPLSVAVLVARILDELEIPYVIGGSVASSLHGEPRSTLDLDLMIEAGVEKTRALAGLLHSSCYVDEDSAVEASRRRTSFNAIHFESSMKIDFFFTESAPFAADQLRRRQAVAFPSGAELFFYTPEDLVIRKLLWFRAGGESSQRQWRDVLGILKTSGSRIDLAYLRLTASSLELVPLLDRALEQAGGDSRL